MLFAPDTLVSAKCETVPYFQGPSSLDLLITYDCQMDCPTCFALPQEAGVHPISLEDWKHIVLLSSLTGTRQIIFTGYEPLMSTDLPELLQYTKSLKLGTTLSTNAILFSDTHESMMPFVDEIGIPIDGSTPEIHSLIRTPNGEFQFEAAIEAIKIIKAQYPYVELTVRTLVTAKNQDDIINIPLMLQDNGIDIRTVRFKVYQFNPIGPQFSRDHIREWGVSTSEFLHIVAQLREFRDADGTLLWFQYFPIEVAEKTHILVYPNGDAMIVVRDTTSSPYESPIFKPHRLGNLATGFSEAMIEWQHVTKTGSQTYLRWPPVSRHQLRTLIRI